MIGLCYTPFTDRGDRLHFELLKDMYDVDTLYERYNPTADGKHTEIDNYSELPATKLVVLTSQHAPDMPGDQDLLTYNHPTDCIYVFGGDEYQLNEADFTGLDYDKVYMPVPKQLEPYASQIAFIVLWDRLRKQP